MKFLEAMLPYFESEKLEALVFILPVGLLCLVFGAWLMAEGQPGFTRGVAIPFLALGLLMTVVGGTVGFRTPAQVDQIRQDFKNNPASAIEAEKLRMDKVNRAWPWYLALWVAFGVIGLALRMLSASDFLQGLGIALVFFAGVGLLIDGFADRRARAYSGAMAESRAAN